MSYCHKLCHLSAPPADMAALRPHLIHMSRATTSAVTDDESPTARHCLLLGDAV